MERKRIEGYAGFAGHRAMLESTLYMSGELFKSMDAIDSQIAKDLLGMLGKDINPDATFLDLGEDEGELTFTTMRNAKRKLEQIYKNDPEFVSTLEKPGEIYDPSRWARMASSVIKNQAPDFWKESRNPISLGRFVRKVFPGKYSDQEIEKFVNQFKAQTSKANEFVVVDGKDIEWHYSRENQHENTGDLGKSCMRGKKGIFGIYVNNPQACRLLSLMSGGKVRGRALVWKVDENKEGIEYFMDRQYTCEQHEPELFRKYAADQGWAYKTHNNHTSPAQITWRGHAISAELTVSLGKAPDGTYEYGKYPYMDTFKRYDPKTGRLHNDDDREQNDGQYILEDTNGGYDEIMPGVYSRYHGTTIPRDQAVWSDPYNDWIYYEDSVYVEGEGYYNSDDEDVVWCEWDEEWRLVSDCVWSVDKCEWISKGNSVLGVYDVHPDGDISVSRYDKRDDELVKIDKEMRWYKVMRSKDTNWKGVDFIRSIISVKWATEEKITLPGKYFPKIFKVFVYQVAEVGENPMLPKEYLQAIVDSGAMLTKQDCRILGLVPKPSQTGGDAIWQIDDFEYHRMLSEAGPKGEPLLDKLAALLKQGELGSLHDEEERDDRMSRIMGMMPDE